MNISDNAKKLGIGFGMVAKFTVNYMEVNSNVVFVLCGLQEPELCLNVKKIILILLENFNGIFLLVLFN